MWRSTLPNISVFLRFMEEGDKLNIRDTDVELLCLGLGDTLVETAVPMECRAKGGALKEGSGRALRIYCAREKTVGQVSKVKPQGSKHAEETTHRFS